MRKLFFALLMSLPLAAWAQYYRLGPMTASGNTQKAAIDGLYYELQQSGSTRTATVTYEKTDENGMYRSSYAGDVVIPEKVKHKGRTYKVESVGKGAFANCAELTSVTLPSGVEAIGDIAFGNCTGLKSVNIPCSVSRIGGGAFYACTSLQHVDFEEADSTVQNRLEFGKSAFYGCRALEQIYICSTPQPVRLSSSAFAECRRLRSFRTLGMISGLGSNVFQNCTSLTEIDFDRIESASKDAFEGCTNFSEDDTAKWNAFLENQEKKELQERRNKIELYGPPVISKDFMAEGHVCIDSIYYAIDTKFCYAVVEKSEAVRGQIKLLTSVGWQGTTYPVLEIADEVFKENKHLVSISMPDSLQRIGVSAFEGCAALRDICFGDTIASFAIAERAFYGCTSLTSFVIPEIFPNFYGWAAGDIAQQAFGECTHLQEVNTRDGMNALGARVFENCSHLEKVDFGGIMTSIAEDAFEGCSLFTAEKTEAIRTRASENKKLPTSSAEFPGDKYAWLQKHINYPSACQAQGIQGRVSVLFYIELDGSITEAKALRGPDEELRKEAVRVVRSMPKWKPAVMAGKPVRTSYVLPVLFRLS